MLPALNSPFPSLANFIYHVYILSRHRGNGENSIDCELNGEVFRPYLMDRLTLFGLFAVTAMLVCYALEDHSHWFVLGFAVSCALGSAYGFLQGAWPFGVVEAIWCLVAVRRWNKKNWHSIESK
jgi:hypothetical protein